MINDHVDEEEKDADGGVGGSAAAADDDDDDDVDSASGWFGMNDDIDNLVQ